MKRSIWVVVAGLLMPALVSASPVSEAQKKLLAKRAAEADCYRKLTEIVMGLKINGNTLVRDFVTESDTIQTEVNSFIRGIRLSAPRYFDAGSCEVTGEITWKKVVACLRETHSRHYVGDHIKASDFNAMESRNEISVIKATGTGAPRPDAPIDQADGTVCQPGQEEYPSPSIPDLWRQIGPQGRLMAMRAAELDAYRRLAEQLRGFKITSTTSVRDFVTESDEVATDLNTTLRGAKTVHVYFHKDEPIVEVTKEIPWEKIIATIRESTTTHIKNNHIKDSVFREVTERVEKKYFRATGMGIPPERFVDRGRSAMKVAPPAWLSKPISATGEGVIKNEGNAAQAKLMATRAAELDAKRKLAALVGGLEVQGSTKVRDFVGKRDEIRTELDAVIDGAYIKNTQVGTDTVKVTVEVPGARVWNVIADELGSAGSATSQQEEKTE